MYDKVRTNVISLCEKMKDKIPWCMLFIDNMILIDENTTNIGKQTWTIAREKINWK